MPRALLSIFCALLALPALAESPQWAPDMATSRIGFVTYWQNAPVKGVFTAWTADIRFDPDDLSAGRVAVEIQTGSADTNYADRDAEIKKSDWFAVQAFPTATFSAETFRHVEGDAYEADGVLAIKGVEQPMTLPFTLKIEGDAAVMAATVPVSRLAFTIGEGQWERTDFIKDDVTVEIEVNATRKE